MGVYTKERCHSEPVEEQCVNPMPAILRQAQDDIPHTSV
jgi:hypothetical protein